MASPTQLIYTDNPGSIPADYVIPAGLDLVLQSVVVRWDGTSAAGAFKPCLSVYSQDGKLVGRFFPSQEMAIGDTGVVTYAPFLSDSGVPSGTPAVPSILYDYTLSADSASIDTATDGPLAGTISPSFRLLELWLVARTDEAVVQSSTRMRVNGDSGNNYDRVYVSGDGVGASTVKQLAQSSWTPAAVAGANSQAGYYSVQRMTFPSYSSSAHNKTGECIHAHPGGATVGDCFVAPQTLGWRSTDAISRFTITVVTAGAKYKAGTRLMIYGR